MGEGVKVNWSFHWITYPMLFVYFLPILVIWVAAWHSGMFVNDSALLYYARAITGPFYDSFRASLGTIVLPFVTAYAVKDRLTNHRVPGETLFLFCILLAIFLGVTLLYGVIDLHRQTLLRATQTIDGRDVSVYVIFRDTAMTYAKETVGYIALVLGIALRPAGGGGAKVAA